MYRYTITFSADRLDEGSLRDLLEDQFRVYDCAVTRSKVGRVEAGPQVLAGERPRSSGVVRRDQLMSFFETGELVTPKVIRKALTGVSATRLQGDLARLCDEGLIRKASHGLYQSTRFPAATPEQVSEYRGRKRVRVTGEEDEQFLKYLSEPRFATDVRTRLGVSRQRVDQRLKLHMEKGLLHRREVSPNAYLYCTNLEKLDEELSERERHPSHAARLLLGALEDEPVLVNDLAAFCGMGVDAALSAAEELVARGLAGMFRFGRIRMVHLTDDGRQSEFAVIESPKIAPSDLSAALGDHRGDVVELLAVLGEATSRELTMAMRGLHPQKGDPRMGQRVQRLRGEGLLKSTSVGRHNKHPSHTLTELGEEVWRYIKPFRDPPSRSVVHGYIRDGMEALRASLPGGGGAIWRPSGPALAMMRVMDAMGAVTQREIVTLMDEPFSNPKSATLSLKGLRERGLVASEGAGTSRDPLKWTILEAGREFLRVT
ncbi:hypothetical protein [Albimonas pacifica]|nr:hypothetical protein [Albimonas pacifica]